MLIYNTHKKNIVKAIILSGTISLFLSFLVYANILGNSRDQSNYMTMIETLVTKGCRDSRGNYNIQNVEFGFQEEICALSYIFKDVNIIYAFQVFISIFLKLTFFSILFTAPKTYRQSLNVTIAFLMGLIVYFLRCFPLHDFTQIRISISIGFMLISLPFLMPALIAPYELTLNRRRNTLADITHSDFATENECLSTQHISSENVGVNDSPASNINIKSLRENHDKIVLYGFLQVRSRIFAFALLIGTAFSFHYSIALIMPFIIIATRVSSRQKFLSIILLTSIASAILIGFLYFSISSNMMFLYADEKIYTNYDDVNPFSVLKLLDILSVIVAFRVIDFRVPLQAFCLTAYTCALIQFYCIFFSGLPTTYAFRLSEVLIVFSAFLVASLNTRKQLVWLAPIILIASLRAFLNYIDESFFMFF